MAVREISDFDTAKAIIVSKDFDNYSMAERYRELERRTGLRFPHAIRLLEHLPVFMNGDAHQRIRKAMARQISKTKDCQFARAQAVFADLVERHFRPGAEIDLVTDVATPLWRAISAEIVPRDGLSVELVDQIPGLFSPILSIRERQRIDREIGAFEAASPGEDNLVLLCLAALGARPFIGSWSLSVYAVLQDNPGRRLPEIEWPAAYADSSLTYVDRMCTRAVAEQAIEEGDRVRCMTQHPDYSAAQRKQALFGFGGHTCLGKSISEKVWTMSTGELARLDLAAECLGKEMSPHNDPFSMPASIRIALS